MRRGSRNLTMLETTNGTSADSSKNDTSVVLEKCPIIKSHKRLHYETAHVPLRKHRVFLLVSNVTIAIQAFSTEKKCPKSATF